MITKQDIQYTYPQLQFFRNGTFQFTIDNEIELHNVRLLAAKGGWWNEVEFRWNDHVIYMTETFDLDKWPKGMYDGEVRQFAQLIRMKRGQIIEVQTVNS